VGCFESRVDGLGLKREEPAALIVAFLAEHFGSV
jgi:hypothetical protein